MDGLVALYLFDERSGDIVRDHSGSGLALDLLVPEELKIIEGFFLDAYFTTSFQYLKDVIVNILVFIPFGFLLHRTMRRRHRSSLKIVAFILIIGVLFTFAIESLQYFVVTRNSSLIDVICNTIGVALGIAVDRLSAFKTKRNG
jgi:glycopeptide antibiotics resistance protein